MDLAQPTRWFDGISNYFDSGRTLALSDEQIRNAEHFDGWCREYLKWPDEHWEDRPAGVPSHDPAKNAYHIQRLAVEFEKTGEWIGSALEVNEAGAVIEGNHRVRAVKYLDRSKGILIPAPSDIHIHLRGNRYRSGERKAVIVGPANLLAKVMLIVAAVDDVNASESAAEWFNTPHGALDNRSPLALLQQGDFKRVWDAVRGLQPSALIQSLEDG